MKPQVHLRREDEEQFIYDYTLPFVINQFCICLCEKSFAKLIPGIFNQDILICSHIFCQIPSLQQRAARSGAVRTVRRFRRVLGAGILCQIKKRFPDIQGATGLAS